MTSVPSLPFSDWAITIIFLVFVAATVAGALIAVNTLRIIRAVCGLAMACIGIAGLFYFLNSPFLALMEILIYVGAVCVTVIFAVMLAEPDEPAPEKLRKPYPVFGVLGAMVVGFAIFAAITKLSLTAKWPNPVAKLDDGSIKTIGNELLSTYALPFEVISLVLLVAIIGALVIARGGRSKE